MQLANPRFKSMWEDFGYFTGSLFFMEFYEPVLKSTELIIKNCKRHAINVNETVCHLWFDHQMTRTLRLILVSLCGEKDSTPVMPIHLFLIGLSCKICLKQGNFSLTSFLKLIILIVCVVVLHCYECTLTLIAIYGLTKKT